MKKHILALFCALALLMGSVPAAALEGEVLRTADTLHTLGLVSGSGSNYALDSPVTRAQATVLLVRLTGAEQAAQAAAQATSFTDLPDWAAYAVAYATRQGWVSGVSSTSFGPDGAVTADAWCAMLLRSLGWNERNGDFTTADAAAFARRIGLVSRLHEGNMTRGDVFETMRESLTFSYKDGSSTVIGRLVERGVCSRAAANALGLLDQELTAREAADRHMAAMFCLAVYTDQTPPDNQTAANQASGFLITSDGLAVTNYHSIAGGTRAVATLFNGESYNVTEVVYYDVAIDIAVIRLSRTSTAGTTTSAFATLELAGTDDIRPGDVVYALGNPLGLGLAVSSGIISDTARVVEESYSLPCVMNTADISEGSSGGALLNVYGQVVAVTSGAYAYGNNMYLAVPVDPVMSADLTARGKTLEAVAKLEESE